MKYLLFLFITLYQYTLSPILFSIFGQQCRYTPSCSVYAKQAILEKGVIIGGYLAVRRLLSCQPFRSFHPEFISGSEYFDDRK